VQNLSAKLGGGNIFFNATHCCTHPAWAWCKASLRSYDTNTWATDKAHISFAEKGISKAFRAVFCLLTKDMVGWRWLWNTGTVHRCVFQLNRYKIVLDLMGYVWLIMMDFDEFDRLGWWILIDYDGVWWIVIDYDALCDGLWWIFAPTRPLSLMVMPWPQFPDPWILH